MSNRNKRISNLLTKLRVDEKSVLFAKGKTLDNKTITKISESSYVKDKALFNLCNEFVKNSGKTSDFKDKKVIINTPFTPQKISHSERGHASYHRWYHATHMR